ncbi:hypothetical protein FA95DRAFT_1614266 [Auriscalpium vulgare]|uniref:Uncharacterized protein n=1 Tax=Auriscalpium vulgare TaxID=40419 RepID=A0ACB8R080_9AGAM|nr:hypothetical protein FA95DRAFT_1614266 [Auriscalpium vulgare]
MKAASTATTAGLYYQRKRDERKHYQKLYDQANKGRRKLSKAARQAMAGKRRREHTYRCSISHSDSTDDPRRDADAESVLSDDVVALRDSLSDRLGEEHWVLEFIQTVQTWIDRRGSPRTISGSIICDDSLQAFIKSKSSQNRDETHGVLC